MPNSPRTASYVSIAASAVLSFVCLLTVGHISDIARSSLGSLRPDLVLPASTALLFAHARSIRHCAYAVGLLILLVGVVSVRCAPDSDQAMRRAMRFSTGSAAFCSIVLVAALICIIQAFISGVITSLPP
jgi:hypothetical protein